MAITTTVATEASASRIRFFVSGNLSQNLILKKGKIMKTNLTNDRNLLFKWACKGLKYFLLILLGFAIAYVISKVFGASTIVQILLASIVWEWLFRIAVFIFCFFAIAVIYESCR
ncbi:hypothetical protein [Scytonema sp. NUACC21]